MEPPAKRGSIQKLTVTVLLAIAGFHHQSYAASMGGRPIGGEYAEASLSHDPGYVLCARHDALHGIRRGIYNRSNQ